MLVLNFFLIYVARLVAMGQLVDWAARAPKGKACLASAHIDTSRTGMMSYASDIFAMKGDEFGPTYNCSSSEVPILYHRCTEGGRLCPVASENIAQSLRPNKWKIDPAICQFVKHASSNTPPTVYILGGSVTDGRHTAGCCCDLDSQCPKDPDVRPANLVQDPNNAPKCESYFPQNYVAGGCGWVHYFARYMNHAFPNVKVRQMAIGGTTSVTVFLGGRNELLNLPLQPHDLVIYDYSVNDHTQHARDLDLMGFSLEGMVRRFWQVGAIPAIILIESWPHVERYIIYAYLSVS